MRVSKWISGLLEHPLVDAATDAARTTRDGLGTAVSDNEQEEVEDPDPLRWGPVDGPAPTDDAERSPIVKFDVVVDGETIPAEVQFWMQRGGGAILGAWAINGQDGKCAVLDREDGRLWLGKKPFWTNAGEKRPYIDLSEEVSMALWQAFSSLMARYQSMNVGVLADEVDGEPAFAESPAPTTADSGEVITVPVSTQTATLPARFQPWSPESGGAVYLAWQIGEQEGTYGISHAAGVWIGRDAKFSAPSGVRSPFVYINERDVEDQFREEADALRESASGEAIGCGEFGEVIKATHPNAPGKNNPWGKVEQGDEDSEADALNEE